jgi:hypothetical protein
MRNPAATSICTIDSDRRGCPWRLPGIRVSTDILYGYIPDISEIKDLIIHNKILTYLCIYMTTRRTKNNGCSTVKTRCVAAVPGDIEKMNIGAKSRTILNKYKHFQRIF